MKVLILSNQKFNLDKKRKSINIYKGYMEHDRTTTAESYCVIRDGGLELLDI